MCNGWLREGEDDGGNIQLLEQKIQDGEVEREGQEDLLRLDYCTP